jgi:hypothetical protein
VSDEELITAIKTMITFELLVLAMTSPEYLTDPYYKDFGAAMRERFEVLKLRSLVK